MASFLNSKARGDIRSFENGDMEEINSFLSGLELGSHILDGKIIALRAASVPIKCEIKEEGKAVINSIEISACPDDSSIPSNKTTSNVNNNSASYLRCGKIVNIKSASNLTIESLGTNCHRRRSFSLGSSSNNGEPILLPQPTPCSRGTTFPVAKVSSNYRRIPSRIRSSSLTMFDKSVIRKPSKAMLSHHFYLRELVIYAMSECFPDKCFDLSDPSLQQFSFLSAQEVIMKVQSNILFKL